MTSSAFGSSLESNAEARSKCSELELATAITGASSPSSSPGENQRPLLFHANIPDGWQQGKGAFGGLVVAILARALIASDDDRSRRLRSLTADLCAPALPGAAVVEVSTLRRGASITYADARLVQEGAIVARASAALASSRSVAPAAIKTSLDRDGNPRRVPEPSGDRSQAQTPTTPPWDDVPVLPVEPPLGPVFARKYEYRSTGPLPFSGGREPRTEGWLREKAPGEVLDEAAIIGLLDAWWPTTFSIESAPRAVATIGYTMQLLVDPRTLPPSEPLFYRARGVASGDNFFVEMRELWSSGSSDTLVAMNQQTFALLS